VPVADDLAGLVVKSPSSVADFQSRARPTIACWTRTAAPTASKKSWAARESTGQAAARRHAEYFPGSPHSGLRQRAIPCRKPIGRNATADTLGNVRAGPRMGILRRRRRARSEAALTCRGSAGFGSTCRLFRRMFASRAGVGACAGWTDGAMGFNTLAHAAFGGPLGWSLTYGPRYVAAGERGPALTNHPSNWRTGSMTRTIALRAPLGVCCRSTNSTMANFFKSTRVRSTFHQGQRRALGDPTRLDAGRSASLLCRCTFLFLATKNGAHVVTSTRRNASLDLPSREAQYFSSRFADLDALFFRCPASLWPGKVSSDQSLRLVEDNVEGRGRANGPRLDLLQRAGPRSACPITFLAGDFDAAERYGDVLFKPRLSVTRYAFGGFGRAVSRA